MPGVAVHGFWGVVGPDAWPGWPDAGFLVGNAGKSSKLATGAFLVVEIGLAVVVDGFWTTTFWVNGIFCGGKGCCARGVVTGTVGGVDTTSFDVGIVDAVWGAFGVVEGTAGACFGVEGVTGTCLGVVTEDGVVNLPVVVGTVLETASSPSFSLFLSFFQNARPLKNPPFFVVISGAAVVVVVALITGL